MEIINIAASDIPACAAPFMAAYNKMPWNYKWQLPKAIQYLTEYALSPKFVGFAVVNGPVVSGALLGHTKTWWTGTQFMIDELFVDPTIQGKGYGKLLLEKAEQYARDNNITTLTLMTNKFMPAMQFYNKHDFNRVDQYTFMFRQL